jgi:hypothetical protein
MSLLSLTQSIAFTQTFIYVVRLLVFDIKRMTAGRVATRTSAHLCSVKQKTPSVRIGFTSSVRLVFKRDSGQKKACLPAGRAATRVYDCAAPLILRGGSPVGFR